MSGSESKPGITMVSIGEAEGQADPSTRRGTRIFQRYIQPCLTELFGTTIFVFVGCSSVVGNDNASILPPAIAHGLTLAVLISLFGSISGGHFNPAVSLSVYLCGGMELRLLGPYFLAQMFGGMIGAGLTKGIYSASFYKPNIGGAFNTVLLHGDLGKATAAEGMMTLILTMVVCMSALNSQTRSKWAPFLIGLTVTANILCGGRMSGGCMNPARAFGPAVAANQWQHHWIYWVGPTGGALLSTILIRLVFGDENIRVSLKFVHNSIERARST